MELVACKSKSTVLIDPAKSYTEIYLPMLVLEVAVKIPDGITLTFSLKTLPPITVAVVVSLPSLVMPSRLIKLSYKNLRVTRSWFAIGSAKSLALQEYTLVTVVVSVPIVTVLEPKPLPVKSLLNFGLGSVNNVLVLLEIVMLLLENVTPMPCPPTRSLIVSTTPVPESQVETIWFPGPSRRVKSGSCLYGEP